MHDRAAAHDEATLATFVANVADCAIFALDTAGHIATWNVGAEKIKGYSADEVIGQHFSRFYPPEDVAAGLPQRLLGQAEREGQARHEGWRVRKDGTRFWADVLITAVRDEAGELRAFLKLTRDLTERRQAQDLLRQSEERLRLLVESVEDYAIFMLDPAGQVMSWNPGAQRLKGYTPAEAIGLHFSRFYPPEDVAAGKPARELEEARARGRVEDEGWRVRKDGSRFWANVVITAVHDASGHLRGFAKVTRDMTDRKRAAEELAARAAQQAALAALGTFALQSHEVGPVLERTVRAVAATLGMDLGLLLELDEARSELVVVARSGPFPLERVALDDTALARRTLQTRGAVVCRDLRVEPSLAGAPVLLRHGVVSGATVLIHGADPSRPFGVLAALHRSTRLLSEDDVHFLEAVAAIVASAVARRAAEEQAVAERTRAREAQAQVRERDEFISIVAHELRTPVTALSLKLEGVSTLLRGDADPARLAKVVPGRLDGAIKQTQRLAALVERLLDVSRLAMGVVELHREPCDLATIVREVVHDLREQAAETRTTVAVGGAPSLPGSWDGARLRQILTNLVANAIKYGEGRPVRVEVQRVDGEAVVRVTDQGIGIAPEDQARIFGRFQRAAPLPNYGGVGLGLFVSRQLALAHGGDILVDSAPGQGATFELRLPAGTAGR